MFFSFPSETRGLVRDVALQTGRPDRKHFLLTIHWHVHEYDKHSKTSSPLFPHISSSTVLSSERYAFYYWGRIHTHTLTHSCRKCVTSEVCAPPCRHRSRCSPRIGAGFSSLCPWNKEVRETSTTSRCSPKRSFSPRDLITASVKNSLQQTVSSVFSNWFSFSHGATRTRFAT